MKLEAPLAGTRRAASRPAQLEAAAFVWILRVVELEAAIVRRLVVALCPVAPGFWILDIE